MDNKSVGIVIAVAIAVLMGAILIAIIAEQTVDKTALTEQVDSINKATAYSGAQINESKTMSLSKGSVTGWRADDSSCSISSIVVKNASVTLTNAACAPTGSGDYYYVKNAGYFVFCNNTNIREQPNTSITATYSYCADDYVSSSWGRTLMNMVPGFFAIAILVVSVFVIFYILKKEGIDV